MKYIIAIDLDGTLKNQSGKISKRAKQVIKKLSNKGHIIVVASGRPRLYTKEISDKLELNTYTISINGSEIYDIKNDQVIYESIIDSKVSQELFDTAKSKNIRTVIVSNEKEYVTHYKHHDKQTLIEELPNTKVNQMFFMSNNIPITEEFQNKVINEYNLNIVTSYTPFKDYAWFSALNKDSSKGKALTYLKQHLNEEYKLITIGNDYNDISMFQIADEAVAVYNAVDEAKKYATKIIESNTNDGVAKYLETLL